MRSTAIIRRVMSAPQYVFGYGSLAADLGSPDQARRGDGFVAELEGWARGWGVAMDNARDLPGYKYYTDPGGARPAVFVCFLDLTPAPGEHVNGLCLPVSASQLSALDARERNYERLDVSERIDGGARVWAYVGTPAGRARFAQGVAGGTAVIQRAYLEAVRAAFRALGEAQWAACRRSLDPGPLPVRSLTRRELA